MIYQYDIETLAGIDPSAFEMALTEDSVDMGLDSLSFRRRAGSSLVIAETDDETTHLADYEETLRACAARALDRVCAG